MNTKLITGTKPKKELNLPKLTADKRNRVVTKHFTNLAMYLERNELSLLNWLIYQSDVNNVFNYNSKLLLMYRQAVIEANKEYNGKKDIKISLTFIRHCLKNLIESGYILPMEENKFIINKSLTFHKKTR